ncbi:TerB N-terminal domain-containing protein [Dactylosporangium sp. NPDC005572]|uniref:tellurite resistance TerB family protein n=1 Tax=Dactylosporangium sp. NPDC005572 TaxID=3156889 RepID=UPI0033B153FD
MGQHGGAWDGASMAGRSGAAPVVAPRPVLHAVGPQAVWVPPGQVLNVAGHRIPGGMFYTGRGLRDARGGSEPALIDPGLPVDPARPDWDGSNLPYWPSYATIPPGARAAYLAWLADGRRYPRAPIGYVFLFFYGLERRVLSDLKHDGTVRYELATIAVEVRRLLGIYGESRSFRSYATDFLTVLDLVGDGSGSITVPDEPPPAVGDCWSPPIALRIGLGCFARDGEPVPVEWARTWAWFHPSIYARTPQERCPDEFRELFAIRYAERFGAGIVLGAGGRQLTSEYDPASAGIGKVTVRMRAPDVLEEPSASARLRDLVGSVTNDLDAYSRWVGRNPDKRGSFAEAALLPGELLAGRAGQVAPLRDWCEENVERGVIDAADLLRFWGPVTPGKATKAESVGLVQLLGRLGFGVEPDVRMGGPTLAEGPAVLFRCGPDAPASARPPYLAVTLLLHLAVAVSQADGEVSAAEHEHLVGHVRQAFQLTAAETDRLAAHTRWLTATGVKLTGLKRRLAGLDAATKRDIAEFAVSVAAVDGVVSPGEVATLTKIYKLLDLDGGDVFGRLHDAVSGPVVVRERAPVDDEHLLPPRPARRPASPMTRTGFALDDAAIAAKLADTASVSALLATIFVEDEPQDAAPGKPADPPQPAVAAVDGLDAAHSRLIRLLAAKPSWSRLEFDRLAAECGLLPAGALDVLNEAALDRLGDTVVDGDETLDVNTEILEGLLA